LGTAVATSADNARTTAAAQVQTPQEKIEERIGALKKELADLTNVGNIAITVADGIGTAFGDSFKGIISGSMTAKEALASFFTSVADMFLDMAAQIIAKMIQMAILNTIVGLLPGGGGLGTAVSPEVGAIGQGSSIFAAANGATFSNGIAKFARGGIVDSPTLFKFAQGGAMQTGLMGEAGPEAIMPLTRGPGGQLGVSNFGGSGDVNVVVNVDAKGSSVEGNEQGANQLGRVISAAVQSELIKQQRPGGILAR
jgi:lambda family phage tail tape measure protein